MLLTTAVLDVERVQTAQHVRQRLQGHAVATVAPLGSHHTPISMMIVMGSLFGQLGL
jgi:hypothetical protein